MSDDDIDLSDILELDFMVDPSQLGDMTRVVVTDPVKLVITDPDHEWFSDILGESGYKLAEAGFTFIFDRELAEDMFDLGCAIPAV